MKKINDITDTNYLHISVGAELKNKLIFNAKKNGLSLNAYVRMILTNSLAKEK